MSIINEIVIGHITKYNNDKTGKWDKPTSPPPNTFDLQELYIIGKAIVSDLEGKLSDKLISV